MTTFLKRMISLDDWLEYGFYDECGSAYMSYAGTLAMETYTRGVMDGARLYYAIVNRELPMSTSGE